MTMVDTRAAIAGELKKAWGWLLAWGILLIVAGVIGLGYEFAVSVVTTVFVGGLLVVYGVMEVVHAFKHRRWSGFFLFLLGGLLSIVAGVVIWTNPLVGMKVLTLLIASYFLVLGVFRAVGAVSSRHPGWGWGLFNGVVSALLGLLVWNGWPDSALWVIGMFVSIDMIFQGWNYVMLAFVARRGAAVVAPGGHAA
ncbi:MAG TPA: HdeD family acid-resistance protein [Anaeromyxobacteraceae bacterium]|nr:HdeD family acid-resistance protein [Anaeromyxobacteraceae bacterium]